MLVHLQHCPQYLSRFQARLVGQAVTQIQQLRERQSDDLFKIGTIFARLEAVDFAYCQQTLYASKNGGSVARIQQLNCNVEEVGPLLREVVGEHLLEGGNELGAHIGL